MSATIKERRRNGWKTAEELKRSGDETGGLREDLWVISWRTCRVPLVHVCSVNGIANLNEVTMNVIVSAETFMTITVRPARWQWPAGEENLLTFDL